MRAAGKGRRQGGQGTAAGPGSIPISYLQPEAEVDICRALHGGRRRRGCVEGEALVAQALPRSALGAAAAVEGHRDALQRGAGAERELAPDEVLALDAEAEAEGPA